MTDAQPAFFERLFKRLLRRYQALDRKVVALSILATLVSYYVLFTHAFLIAFALLTLTLMGIFSLVAYVKNTVIRSISLGYELGAVSFAVLALIYMGVVPS